MTWNKDCSDISTYSDIIKMHIEDEDPTVCVINESNVKPEDDLSSIFPNYIAENKFEKNHPKARTTVLIEKNTVHYERMKNMEKENICTVWLRIKFNGSKWPYLGVCYRQWRLPQEAGIITSGRTMEQRVHPLHPRTCRRGAERC